VDDGDDKDHPILVDEETSEDHSAITDEDDHGDLPTTAELLVEIRGMEH
jgi:hypothetical protein